MPRRSAPPESQDYNGTVYRVIDSLPGLPLLPGDCLSYDPVGPWHWMIVRPVDQRIVVDAFNAHIIRRTYGPATTIEPAAKQRATRAPYLTIVDGKLAKRERST